MNKRAPLIAAAVALVLVVLSFLFLVKPKMSAVSEAKSKLTETQDQTRTLQTALAILRDDEANQSKYHDTIATVDQRVPPTMDQQGVLTLLRVAAEQSGVDHISATFGAPTVSTTTSVSVFPVSVTLQGRYFTIAEFFYKIETLPRAAKVTQFSLSPGGSAIGGPAPPGTMQSQIAVEFYTSDTSAGPGSEPGSQPPESFNPSPAPTPSPSGAP
jgi:Tfp pilus assembly protein PilO